MRKQIIAILLGAANVAAPIFAQEISGVCTGIFTNLVGNENLKASHKFLPPLVD